MAPLHTTPIPQQAPQAAPDRVHEHGWRVESRHMTREGRILYVRCVDCGARRVDLQPVSSTPPAPLSRALDGE